MMLTKRLNLVKLIITGTLLISLLGVLAPKAYCGELMGYDNDESGYFYFIDDGADLFDEAEEDSIYDKLFELSDIGNIGVVTLDSNPYGNISTYTYEYNKEYFAYQDTAIFFIDMDTRQISVSGNGALEGRLKPYYTSITDNVYTYAMNADYAGCALAALDQIGAILSGGRIAQPMKYLSNALLSIIIALVLSYFIARNASRTAKASNKEVRSGLFSKFNFNNPVAKHVSTTREYSPRSESSGSSGGGGGSSGGGGGSSGSHGF